MLSYPGDFDILRLYINCLISSESTGQQYEQATQCIENSAVLESYSETVQSGEIISLISYS